MNNKILAAVQKTLSINKSQPQFFCLLLHQFVPTFPAPVCSVSLPIPSRAECVGRESVWGGWVCFGFFLPGSFLWQYNLLLSLRKEVGCPNFSILSEVQPTLQQLQQSFLIPVSLWLDLAMQRVLIDIYHYTNYCKIPKFLSLTRVNLSHWCRFEDKILIWLFYRSFHARYVEQAPLYMKA